MQTAQASGRSEPPRARRPTLTLRAKLPSPPAAAPVPAAPAAPPAALEPAEPTAAPPPRKQTQDLDRAARRREGQQRRAEQVARRELEAQVSALIWTVQERYPATFCRPPVPLAIGINAELEREWPRPVVQGLFRFWTRTTAYLEAVAAGEMRRDLAGSPTEPPTEDQRAAARVGLERRAAARAVREGLPKAMPDPSPD
jgi:hypothetical protein